MKGEIEVADTVKKILNFAKRKWIYIWLIVAAVAACGVTVWAIYSTGSNEMRKIARGTGDTPEQAFSSNYLSVSGGTKNYETTKNETGVPYDVTVELYNYDTATPGTLYNGVITYTLKATLVDSSGKELDAAKIGNNTVKIFKADDAGNKIEEIITLNSSKTGVQTVLASDSFGNAVAGYTEVTAATKKYIIEYSSGCYGSIYVKLEAVTTTSGLESLSGIIGVTEQKTAISQGWTVSLAEDTTNEPSEYDGYNLVVKGSGEATIEITLNTTYLEANKFFKDLYNFDDGEVDVSTDGKTIKIYANSTTHGRNRYEIQLYKTGKDECSDWKKMISSTDETAWVYYSVDNESDTTTNEANN